MSYPSIIELIFEDSQSKAIYQIPKSLQELQASIINKQQNQSNQNFWIFANCTLFDQEEERQIQIEEDYKKMLEYCQEKVLATLTLQIRKQSERSPIALNSDLASNQQTQNKAQMQCNPIQFQVKTQQFQEDNLVKLNEDYGQAQQQQQKSKYYQHQQQQYNISQDQNCQAKKNQQAENQKKDIFQKQVIENFKSICNNFSLSINEAKQKYQQDNLNQPQKGNLILEQNFIIKQIEQMTKSLDFSNQIQTIAKHCADKIFYKEINKIENQLALQEQKIKDEIKISNNLGNEIQQHNLKQQETMLQRKQVLKGQIIAQQNEIFLFTEEELKLTLQVFIAVMQKIQEFINDRINKFRFNANKSQNDKNLQVQCKLIKRKW